MTATFNKNQQSAIMCNDSKILCLAGAGTGKTFSLVHRLDRLIKDGADPTGILVLTFTNAAALEMKSRFSALNPNKLSPEFRTFHAFCYSLIISNRNIRAKLGYSRIPNIASEFAIKKCRKEAEMQTGIKLPANAWKSDDKLSLRQKQDKTVLDMTVANLLKKRNLITFDQLCYDVCELFTDKDPCIQSYLDKYKYIMIDEFQDTDPKQYKFAQAFDHAKQFYVGDALQTLYAFRGADPAIIKSLSISSNWTTIKLTENYRSTTEICEYANNMSKYADDSYRITMQAHKDGPKVVEDTCTMRYEHLDNSTLSTIAAIISKFDGTTAILCRTNKEVKSIQKYFSDNEIPFTSGKKEEETIHVFNAIKDDQYFLEWLASTLNSESYAKFIKERFEIENNGAVYSIDNFMTSFSNAITEDLYKRVKACRFSLESDKPIVAKWADIFATNRIKCPYVEELPEDMDKLIELALDILSEKVTEDATTYIGTIHSSKGLEYDNVILTGVDGYSFKLNSEDNLNAFYVGITRAKTNLHIYFSR